MPLGPAPTHRARRVGLYTPAGAWEIVYESSPLKGAQGARCAG